MKNVIKWSSFVGLFFCCCLCVRVTEAIFQFQYTPWVRCLLKYLKPFITIFVDIYPIVCKITNTEKKNLNSSQFHCLLAEGHNIQAVGQSVIRLRQVHQNGAVIKKLSINFCTLTALQCNLQKETQPHQRKAAHLCACVC